MDVDISFHEQPVDDLALFDLTPEQFPWREPRPDEIQVRRTLMSNELFFDILLELGGLEGPSSLYPPLDVASLRRLLEAVDGASYDSMKRNCLIYYLLKWHGDGREASYAEKKCISPHYVAIADAYWHLDTGINIGRAIALFSDARIVKEYVTKTLDTLSLSDDATSLILKYVRVCKPALTEFEDMRRYCLALAERNFADAWEYQKQFSENFGMRKQLLHSLFEWTCIPKLHPLAFRQLLAIPVSSYEESIMKKYATKPPVELPQASAILLRDVFCIRLIQSFKYIEAVKFDREFPSQNSNSIGSWSLQRKRLLANVISAMPAVERAALEMESGYVETSSRPVSRLSISANGASRTGTGTGNNNPEMSMEDIRPLPTNGMIQSLNRPNGRSMANQYASPRRILSTPRIQPSSSTNGMLSKQSLFTPGASTSSNRQAAPQISLTPNLISRSFRSASSSQLMVNAPLTDMSSISAVPRIGSSVINNPDLNTPPTHVLPNGTPKSNAFTTRNAFFDPPVPQESIFGSQQPRVVDSRLPTGRTSPRKIPITIENATQPSTLHDDDEIVEDTSKFDDLHSIAENEKEDLGYSLFNTTNGSILSYPPSAKARVPSEQPLPPGAFVADAEEELVTERPHYNLRRVSRSPEQPRKQNSRKRAASPENLSLSIPGSLFEGNGQEDEENEDVAPLPTQSKRPARKSRRMSRTSSVDTSDAESSRPVRRSSRLSNASSPTATKPSASRPRKNARTSGADAAAAARKSRKR